MAFMLEPEDGEYLSVQEIIARLKREFRYVKIDQKQAQKEARRHIEFLQIQKERGVIDVPFDEKIQRLEDTMEDRLHLIISDRRAWKDDYLSTILEPDEPIFFGFSSHQHEQAATPLVERCVRALNYEADEL